MPSMPATPKGKYTAKQASSAIKKAKLPKGVSKKVVKETIKNISTGSLGAADTKALKKALGGGPTARATVQQIRADVRGIKKFPGTRKDTAKRGRPRAGGQVRTPHGGTRGTRGPR